MGSWIFKNILRYRKLFYIKFLHKIKFGPENLMKKYANLNRIIINHTQKTTDHIKLKLSLNDLTAINKISNPSKFNNNNNITNSINNNRMTTSSMSVSTFSPRTTQNNSTI